jgi:TonB family protein
MKITLFSEYIEPERRPPDLARKIAGLAVTLVAHGLLVYGLVTARYEIKIIPFKQKLTRVYLAPRAKVKLYRDYERNLAKLPPAKGSGALVVVEPGGTAGSVASSPVETPSAGPGGGPAGPSSRPRPAASPPGAVVIPGQPSSGFVLSYKSGSEKNKVPDLDLSLQARSQAEGPPRGGGPAAAGSRLRPESNADALAGSTGPGGSGYALARSGTGDRVIYRGRVSPGLPSNALNVWGRQAVEAIQQHWILPLTKKEFAEGKVGVTVIVERNGTVSVVRLINSSNISLLDRSALAAIAASLPFPPLPEDFPDGNIEAYFLFDCYAK